LGRAGSVAVEGQITDAAVAPHLLLGGRELGAGEALGRCTATVDQPLRPGEGGGGVGRERGGHRGQGVPLGRTGGGRESEVETTSVGRAYRGDRPVPQRRTGAPALGILLARP